MRRTRTFALICALMIFAVGRPALALRPEVARALELYQDLRFDDARRAFEEALRLEGNRPDDLAAIHLHLGMLYGAADRTEDALRHFKLALAVDPEAELPPGQPPKITEPFATAQEFWGEARLRIEHTPPEGWTAGHPAGLRFETADDMLDMVVAARLQIWRSDDEEVRAYRVDGSGPFIFPVPPELMEREGVIRYRVELMGPSSSIIAILDDEETLAVAVAPRPPPGQDLELTSCGDAECQPSESCDNCPADCGRCPPRIYEQWWFWTVLGVVVAGAAAGTLAALLIPAEGVDFGPPSVQ